MNNLEKIRFCVFSDLHYGNIMPDAYQRLQYILQAAQTQQVDCIISLGDTSWSVTEHKSVPDLWNNISIPHYMVLGNHDMDKNDKQAAIASFKMPYKYYSFEVKDIHFVALDTNYFRVNNIDYDYANGNYYSHPREYVSNEELEWLKTDLAGTDKPCVLLSHSQLNYGAENGCGGCSNYETLHTLLVEHNKKVGFNQVFLALNGHNHTDSYRCWDGIHHLDINSASNLWMGEEYEFLQPEEIFNAEDHLTHEYLKMVAPYKDPLYAIITLDWEAKSLYVKGVESTFVGKTPQQRGHSGIMGGIPVSARISDRQILI